MRCAVVPRTRRHCVLACCQARRLPNTVPARVGDYTDFYTSVYHATNIGKQFRPDNPLLPGYKWGCRSAITVVRRHWWCPAPDCIARSVRACRQARLSPLSAPKRLDYELEMGVYVGRKRAR